MKKVLKIFLLIILLAVFAGGIYYFRFMKKDVPSIFMGTKVKAPIINSYPNYNQINNVIQDGSVYWASSSAGGLVRYDGSAKKITFYNKTNGLLGNSVNSVLKQGDKIFIAIQGEGIQILNIKNNKIEKTYNKSTFVPGSDKSSIDFGNPRIFEDPYTKDVWVGTIQGTYKYNSKTALWDNQSEIWGNPVWEMYFSRDAVWVVGKTNPGAFMLARAGGSWKDLTHQPGFFLDQYLMNTATDDASFYAFTRPSNHTSCADKNVAAMMQAYTPDAGWKGLDAVNELVKFDEEAVELRYEKPYILAIAEENVCNGGNQDQSSYYVIKYNTETKTATREPYKESDIKWLSGRSQEGDALQAKIEKETGIPAEKTIIYVGRDGKPLIQTGSYGNLPTPTFAFLDPATGVYDFSLWDKIKKHKEIKESDLNFQVLSCNQYNDLAKEDKIFLKEYYIGMGGMDIKENVYVYNISKDTVEEIAIPTDNSNPRNIYDIFKCDSREVIYPSTKGFVSYSLETKKETPYYEGFTGEKYCDVSSSCFQAFDGKKKYFMSTSDRELGYFDVTTKKYSYIKIPDTIGGLSLWKKPDVPNGMPDPMHMNYAAEDKLYFGYRVSDAPISQTYIIIYDVKMDKWDSYSLNGYWADRGWLPISIRPFGDKIWVTSSEPLLTLNTDKMTQDTAYLSGINMLENTSVNLFVNDGIMWVGAGNSIGNAGFWSYQPAK